MVSKEDILKKNSKEIELTKDFIHAEKNVLKAMDEYAKEIAIGFHNWRKNNFHETHIGEYEPNPRPKDDNDFKVYNYTIEQLFQQYLNTLKQ